jgi:DNA-binding SARP family transcriptional activator
MRLHELLENAYSSFQQHAKDARVVLLHPRSSYRSLLIARLLNDPNVSCFYYALGPDDISIDSFLAGITHDVANQFPTFGRHIDMLPADKLQNRMDLLETFAEDICELSDSPFFFILDEYDRSDSADEVQWFIEQLVSRLPGQCTLVINSRTLPRLPWISMIAQKWAVMLEDDHLISNDFYDVPREGSQQLEVFALGPGFVLLNSRMIDTWEGHLPRLLFFFALDKPVITRSEICEAFWPELDIDQAVNVFHVTKRRLHKALDMDVLVHEDGYYRVNPDLGIQYDVVDFVAQLMKGRDPNNPNRMESWQAVADLYRGPFLQGHSDSWILARRRDYQAGYLEALTAMAQTRLDAGRPEHALSLYQRALQEDGMHEGLHRQVMQLYMMLGRRSEAAAHYMKLVDDLKITKATPTAETVALYESIMS